MGELFYKAFSMATDSPTIALTKQLIARQSVTPEDDGCQQLMVDRLKNSGFKVEHLRFDNVDNFWAIRGVQGPILCFAGHTDVVPAGNEEAWNTKPFEPTIKDGFLFGRGAADMKGGLAAMVTATENFVKDNPKQRGSFNLGFFPTKISNSVKVKLLLGSLG